MHPKFPSNMTVECRIFTKSDSYLSPGVFSTQYTVSLEIQSFYKTKEIFCFYTELANDWKKLGGVPHWQKMWAMDSEMHVYLHEKYSDKIKKFLRVRKKLGVDPKGMFVNDTMKSVFYGQTAASTLPDPAANSLPNGTNSLPNGTNSLPNGTSSLPTIAERHPQHSYPEPEDTPDSFVLKLSLFFIEHLGVTI